MDPERWRQIDRIFQSVLERPVADRDAFLREACAYDPEREREVRALLSAHLNAAGFLETPPLAPGSSLVTIGTQVSRYRVTEKLGEGGMGVVYKAYDPQLDRFVALKLLSPGLSAEGEAAARFRREARAASALSHPNIVTLHDLGSSQGIDFFVMEYVAGTSLDRLVRPGGLASRSVVRYASHITSALMAAHAAGIVHRDIKPTNIIVSADGHAKILDFGLARLGDPSSDATGAVQAPLTRPGTIMGTPAYMSPEQARGGPVDPRTDLFSLGAVIFELATGHRAFPVPFDWSVRPSAGLPPELELLVRKLLETDAARRYQSAAEVASELERIEGALSEVAQRGWPPGPLRFAIASAALIIVAAVVGYIGFRHSRAPTIAAKDTLVVGDFVNRTGDPVFEGTLREGLTVQLRQSPYLSLISDQKIGAIWKLMRKVGDPALSGDSGRELCQRAGARALVTGSIAKLGSRYVLGLRAEGCSGGEVIDSQQVDIGQKEQVLGALGEMAGKFRARVGESLAAIREHNVPLAEATTSSLDALKAYSNGSALAGKHFDEAALQVKLATEIDPRFASAWGVLAVDYSQLGETALSRHAATQAWKTRERASGPEKFNIEYSYHRNVTGNLEQAWRAVSLWRQTYPRDAVAFGLASGYAANGTGRFDEALEASELSMQLDPDQLPPYQSRAEVLFRLGRFDEALKASDIAEAHHADIVVIRYRIALIRNDPAGAARMLPAIHGNNDTEIAMWHVRALLAAREGRLGEAQQLSRRAIDLARSANLRERTTVLEASQAVCNALYGNREKARNQAEAALRAFDGREVRYAAGLALGLSGDAARSDELAARLERDFPEDTHVQSTYVPTLRALAALCRNETGRAIDLLEANRRYEFGVPPLAFNHSFGNMYPIYVRGLTYRAMHREREAASEFSRFLAHPGLEAGDPAGAVARLELARSLAAAGEIQQARSAFANLIELWKNADPALQLVTVARAEYSRLR